MLYIKYFNIVFGNRKISPPEGKVIYIDSEQLERLFVSDTKGRSR